MDKDEDGSGQPGDGELILGLTGSEVLLKAGSGLDW